MATIKVGGKEFTPEQIQALLDAGLLGGGAKATGAKNDPFNTDYQLQASHGYWSDGTTAGLFARPGAEPEVFSAVRYADSALLAQLFAGVTENVYTEYDILSGVDAGTGSNATDWCAEAPTAGLVRICTQRAQFGEFRMATNSVKLAEIGGRVNRADYDRRIINMPEAFPLFPDFLGGLLTTGDSLNTALGLEVFALGQHLTRVMARVLFHGALANTGGNAELGFMQEFNGFDALIKTGYTDLETGATCNSADSIVTNFASDSVSDGLSEIVETIANTYYRLKTRSAQNGLGEVWNGVIAMHPDLFYALTEIYPCSYLTYSCLLGTSSDNRNNVDARDQVGMRDAMRTGKFLWILGEQVPVHTTWAIEQEASGLGFESTIYFIPLSAGGMRTTYLEGFDMGRADVEQWRQLLPTNDIRVTNGGFYLSTFNRRSTCVEYEFNAKPRLIMRTPWLASRIDNVAYNLPGYTNSPYPSDTYYVNGGRYTSRAPYTA